VFPRPGIPVLSKKSLEPERMFIPAHITFGITLVTTKQSPYSSPAAVRKKLRNTNVGSGGHSLVRAEDEGG